MLSLRSISLLQFRNYSNHRFEFGERVVGICGKNGVGKTNLLDAIHYLCFTKSYFVRDSLNVQAGKAGFRIEGQWNLQDKPETAACILRETGKKEFLLDDQAYTKFSQHIGHYPCVIIAPDDAQLITGASEGRRVFLDSLLCQMDPEYLLQLIAYRKVLDQRNGLLKSWGESGAGDPALLDVLDEQLQKPGEIIFKKRKAFLVSFLPMAKHLYLEIAQQAEDIQLYYESELLGTPFEDLLKATRQRDIYAQRTGTGIHRDDLEFTLAGQPFRNTASQGQRKSLLFALKLAEMEALRKARNFAPLLLLDDVFEKLDDERIASLLHKVCVENDGQVFITDTNRERLSSHLDKLEVGNQIIAL